MTCYLALTPGAADGAKPRGVTPVHMAYALSERGALARSARPSGGLMGLSDRGRAALPDRAALVRAIVRECAAQGFRGVLADLDEAAPPDRRPFLSALAEALAQSGRTLYVPMALAVPHARALAGTAVSGGSLHEHLRALVRAHGAQRLALDVQRLRMDFPVPSFSAEGRPLTAAELDERCARGGAVFYSHALGARYFTYRDGTQTHFVVFDDADTLRAKLSLGESLGIREAFFMLPEVSDLLGSLF